MPGPDKQEKKIDKAALELANSALRARMFDAMTAEQVADYCVVLAKRIINESSDGD